VRRAEALDPTSLLVDQDRRIRIFDRITQFTNKQNYLLWRLDIALKENKPPRPLRTDEFTLGGA
jgi:hypothetical protein